jgi:hypothetical protein
MFEQSEFTFGLLLWSVADEMLADCWMLSQVLPGWTTVVAWQSCPNSPRQRTCWNGPVSISLFSDASNEKTDLAD